MIIKIKEKNNDFNVYKYDNKTDKVIKEKMNRIDMINALNRDTENIQTIGYEYLRFKKMLREKFDMKCMIFFSLICVLLLPIIGYNINLLVSYIIVLLSALAFKKITNNYVDKKVDRKANIYTKKMIYEKNKEVCNAIEKNKIHKNGYDGSLLGIYFSEDYQIVREIKKYNELNEEKHYIEYGKPNLDNNDLSCKKLVHKIK